MKSVTVFMSTYNGEEFLEAQIDSVLNQEGVQVNLLVRDDGSSDKTVDILSKYKEANKLKFKLGNNIGYGRSFLNLFKDVNVKTDYYAYADQDDVWDTCKLQKAVEILESNKSNFGNLYFCNMKVVDNKLKLLSIKDYSDVKISLGSVLVRQRIAGCTMVFDNILFEKANKVNFENYKYHISHEWIYILCLAIGGKVNRDQNAYINYRRHENTATSVGRGVKVRIKSELKPFKIAKNDKLELSKIILKNYFDDLEDEAKELFEKIAVYNKSFLNTISLIRCKELDSAVLLLNIRIRIIILLRAF